MQVLLCVGDDFLRRGLKFAVILELRRGVLNRAKSSIVCNASVTNFRVIPDFPAVFGYPNVKQALILVIQEITGRTNQFKNVQKARIHAVFRAFLYPKGLMDFDKILQDLTKPNPVYLALLLLRIIAYFFKKSEYTIAIMLTLLCGRCILTL